MIFEFILKMILDTIFTPTSGMSLAFPQKTLRKEHDALNTLHQEHVKYSKVLNKMEIRRPNIET